MPTVDRTKVSAITSLFCEKKTPTGSMKMTATKTWRTFVNGERPPEDTPATPRGSSSSVLKVTVQPCTSRTIELAISYSQTASSGVAADATRSAANVLS